MRRRIYSTVGFSHPTALPVIHSFIFNVKNTVVQFLQLNCNDSYIPDGDLLRTEKLHFVCVFFSDVLSVEAQVRP